MIRLTHLTGEPFLLNAELIRYVEERPDTFITLTTGDRMVVRERMEEVLERALAYQQSKHLIPAPRPSRFRESLEKCAAAAPQASAVVSAVSDSE